MNRPTWNNFIGKNFDDNRMAFEALARLLFKTEYGVGDFLPYFKNNAGNETEPIKVGDEVIGFQAKYFEGGGIDANQIIHSLEKACENYPHQTKYIVYTNGEFGNPRGKATMPKGKAKIEELAKAKNMEVRWMCGNDVLDLVQNNELAYDVFFNPQSNLHLLQKHVDEYNKLKLSAISNFFTIGEKEVKIDCSEHVKKLRTTVESNNDLVIVGESGSGKSAIVKSYCESIVDAQCYAYLILDASRFDVSNVNDVLNFTKRYDVDEFCLYFRGFEHKLLVIDSAEKLLSLSNIEVAETFMWKLKSEGWRLVLTCRTNSIDDVANKFSLLRNDIERDFVEPIAEKHIENIATQNSIGLPKDPKLLKQLTIPFYLARYCESRVREQLTLESFREQIWNQKVRGDGNRAEQTKREVCLLNIVRQMSRIHNYIIPSDSVDVDSASKLVEADILGQEFHKGYFVKHDIYVDWSWDYIVYRDLDAESDLEVHLEKKDFCIQYVNAFKNWLSHRIDACNQDVVDLCNSIFENNVMLREVRISILESIGRSENYARQWFDTNEEKLMENDYRVFNEFVDVLCVSCQDVEQYFEIGGERLSIRKSVGSGWIEAINFMWKHIKTYYKDNALFVFNLVSHFLNYKNSPEESKRYAGLLALRIFDNFAEYRKNGQSCFFPSGGKEWTDLVCKYALSIKEELSSIFEQVARNNWVSHMDPYAELISYILKSHSIDLNNFILYHEFRNEIISLMNLFWKEQPYKEDSWWHNEPPMENKMFGLNENFVYHMDYYPSSAFQTPIYTMLMSECGNGKNFDVVDFIIDFIDSREQIYRERNIRGVMFTDVEVNLRDGKTHNVIISSDLWSLYRGTWCMVHLMESIHMAFERYLLVLAKYDSSKERVNEILWRVLDRSLSCSLYAIVASVVTAYPNDYFEQLIFLMQNIHFLLLDSIRLNYEMTSNITEYGFSHDKFFLKERHEANNLKHRKLGLEDLLTRLQMEANENREQGRLERLYEIVDSLIAQTESLSGDEKERAEFIILRVDTRKMKIEKKVVEGGIVGTLYTPIPTQEMRIRQEAIETDYNESMLGIRLNVWVDYRYRRDFNKAKVYEYDGDVQKVLTTIREIKQALKTQSGNYNLHFGDESIPSKTSSLLLLQYYNQLTEDERRECMHNVLEALENPNDYLSSPISGIDICIESLPILIVSMPEKTEILQEVLITYANSQLIFSNERSCDKIYKMIGESKLWETNGDFMNGVIEKFKQKIGIEVFSEMSPQQAESLLCLLSWNHPLRDIGKLCIEKISEHWKPKGENKYCHQHLDSYTEYLIAVYMLRAPRKEIISLASVYIPCMKNINEFFLNVFSTTCAEFQLYDAFWLVWEEWYDCIINEKDHIKGSVISAYLLDISTIGGIDLGDWFRIENKNVNFYVRVAKDMGTHPSVIYSIVKVFATIGQKYLTRIIPSIDNMCSHLSQLNEDIKKGVLFYLEKMMERFFGEFNDIRRTNMELNNHVVRILTAMRDNGSAMASALLRRV